MKILRWLFVCQDVHGDEVLEYFLLWTAGTVRSPNRRCVIHKYIQI